MCTPNMACTPWSAPPSIMARAPWKVSSPGWKMSRTRPAISERRPMSASATPIPIAACASCPQAWAFPARSLANSTPDRSSIGRASMSTRTATVGPGAVPSISATTPVPAHVFEATPRSSRKDIMVSAVSYVSSPVSGRRCSRRRNAVRSKDIYIPH